MGRWGEGQAHDFKSVSDDSDSHELLAVVAAVHHKRVGETLNNGAVSLAKALDSKAAGGVGDVDRGADLNVVAIVRGRISSGSCKSAAHGQDIEIGAFKPAILAAPPPCKLPAKGSTHVNEMSRTSTSSYDHLLKSLMVPISSVTSLGKTMYPLGFSISTSAVSDMLGDCC